MSSGTCKPGEEKLLQLALSLTGYLVADVVRRIGEERLPPRPRRLTQIRQMAELLERHQGSAAAGGLLLVRKHQRQAQNVR